MRAVTLEKDDKMRNITSMRVYKQVFPKYIVIAYAITRVLQETHKN